MNDPLHEKSPLAWMARNGVAANLLMVILLVGGGLMAFQVKQEVFPDFDLDRVWVTVPYPGAGPDEVEKGILLSIEDGVRGLDGVKEVRARAFEGSGIVEVELLLGADANKALADTRNAVDRITSFPEEAERPIVSLQTTRRQVISLVAYGDQDERVLRELGERMRDELLQDPRITLVELAGIRPPEIAVEVSQANLRTYKLTLDDIAAQVAATALELPAGGVKTPSGEVLLRTAERRDFGREFENIALVSTADGAEVRLADIATVLDAFEDTDEASFFNGRPTVMVNVFRVGDQTPLEVAAAVNEYAEDLRETLPPGLHLATWRDWSEIYGDRMGLLLRNGAIGLILVLAVLGLFLGGRLAFWVTMGIPVSFLGAMLLLPAMNVSINMISLFAFITALGIVVDDAIIVGENIYECRRPGRPPLTAAVQGVRGVATPVVFSVLTNIAAFMPLFFVPGVVGKMFGLIPAIVISVFTISLIECLFVLPAHLSHQRRRAASAASRGPRGLGRMLMWFVRKLYTPLLHAALRWRYLTIAVGLAVLAVTAGFIAGGRISFRLMPYVQSDIAVANVVLPYGVPVEHTKAVVDRLVEGARGVIAEHDGDRILRGIFAQIGRVAGGWHGLGGLSLRGGHQATVEVLLVPSDQREITPEQLVTEWRKRVGELPGLESLSFKYNIGPSAGAPIDIQLSHPEREVLEAAAKDLAERLKSFAGVKDIDDDVALGKPQLDFKIRQEARSLGLTHSRIARQVHSAFYGAEAIRQQRGRDELKVMVRLPAEERRSEYDVEQLLIRTPTGGEIPLFEAAEVVRNRAYTEIKRAQGRRVLDVTADVVPGEADPNKVLAELRDGALPELLARYPGLRYSFGGEQKELKAAMAGIGRGLVLALIAIFAMLAIPLKSYAHPLIVMAAIPFGIVGAVAGHVIMGYSLSVISMMGIVALSGVVVNDSLVLIHSTNKRRREGASAFDAVAGAGARRFRPIILTSLTTFCGLAPMIFETSVQARMMIPMAVGLGFGVLFATFVTLLLVPALYLVTEDIKRPFGA